MTTVKELKRVLHEFKDDDVIAYSLWCVEDVRNCAEANDFPEPTLEQCHQVLEKLDDAECTTGQSWDIMAYYLSEIFE